VVRGARRQGMSPPRGGRQASRDGLTAPPDGGATNHPRPPQATRPKPHPMSQQSVLKPPPAPKTTANLVLLHGWGMNSAVWNGVPEPTWNGLTQHRLDLPGHGESPFPTGRDSLWGWAEASAQPQSESRPVGKGLSPCPGRSRRCWVRPFQVGSGTPFQTAEFMPQPWSRTRLAVVLGAGGGLRTDCCDIGCGFGLVAWGGRGWFVAPPSGGAVNPSLEA